jgi:hypothetical protein
MQLARSGRLVAYHAARALDPGQARHDGHGPAAADARGSRDRPDPRFSPGIHLLGDEDEKSFLRGNINGKNYPPTGKRE